MNKENSIINNPSKVEEVWLAKSGFPFRFPDRERMDLIIVDNFPSLGKLSALRFLEWVLSNPEGVVSLPTGKTPEYFIKWVNYYLLHWDDKELEIYGFNPGKKPDLRGLYFVQIDEFFPIDPEQYNSFYYYVNKFYIEGFGLDKSRALLINSAKIGIPEGKSINDIFPGFVVDISLRIRQTHSHLEKLQKDAILAVDQWCIEYEDRIRSLGGIGFFLGGIGPDGHIAFNVRGSDHYSTTRLTAANYETQATSATDLGGIEISRKRLVITIGLATIVYNPEVTAIIFAAGDAKAKVAADAVQHKASNICPATVLHKVPNARFYITRGAASLLTQRNYLALKEKSELDAGIIERYLVDLSLAHKKRILDLTESELKADMFTAEILAKTKKKADALTKEAAAGLIAKIDRGRMKIENTSFLHIGPHHDDIMLGYLPYIAHLVRPDSNKHTFAYATSGFTAVTNQYVLGQLKKLKQRINSHEFEYLNKEGYFRSDFREGWDRDVYQYLDGAAARSRSMMHEGEARRLLRNLVIVLEESSFHQIENRISEMMQYCATQYPGKKDMLHIQRLKGMIREWEAELLWASFGFSTSCVRHLRMGFYKGDIFTESPNMQRDVVPIYHLLKETAPDFISTAFDPEGSGPDTHYKVLQASAEAIRMYDKEKPGVKILGYRNVWYRFHPCEANLYVPLSLHSMSVLEKAFLRSFGSQKAASFPCYEYDGPFSGLIRRYQVEQYHMLKTCLGREYFYSHESPRLRAAHGFVFLKQMEVGEFLEHSAALQKQVEEV